ncbi:MAG TPA: GtrA family protein [Streptosporangiaceae bacterium]|jgi:putative flippase GtrA
MRSLITGLYRRFEHLIAEFAKFGAVGAIAAVVDLGGAGFLQGDHLTGPLTAKAISTAIATVVSYLGNRFWTFRHRENHAPLRAWTVFIVLNLIGLAVAEAMIGITYYGLGYHGSLAYNVAQVVGTGLATVFRYWSYKKWVFIAPAPAAEETLEPELAGAS